MLPNERRGDVAIIAGREWPAKVHEQREQLIRRIRRDGFAQTMEAVAYTWFNRFAALRYMELHDYLGHGHRVLSSATAGGLPDIVAHASDLAASRQLPGLGADVVTELKLAGNKDGELYRLLLVAQCNALSAAMPFLFERIDDETELLLPDNLLRTDSVIAKLVAEIAEEDWAEVEIIGWLYQFYISEKKDQVIGKVVKSEDIPAATQLFTPNWIVQYLVQNSVGRLWLMANPASTLKAEWPYYIEPAEQTPEVQAQLDELIRQRCLEGSGQWSVVSGQEGRDGDYALSGTDCLAKGNELGRAGVSGHQGVSERRGLWADESSTSGSGIDSFQHRGRSGAEVTGGVSQFSVDRSGVEGRSGNADPDCRASQVSDAGTGRTDTVTAGGDFEDARRTAGTSSLTTNHWPLTTPPLDPESITVLDPACGSGHILVEAYALLKGIYLERGYRLRDIPRLILEKNLYGLDIDDRAAQLAGFALLMKARADDRRLFNDPPRLNVLSLQESKGLDLDELATHLASFGIQRGTIKALLDTFEHAKTFGSLIQIPDALNAQLPALAEALGKANETGDLYAQAAAQDLLPLVEQAKVLGRKFDAVVANPPYMGGKGMNGALKEFAKAAFPDSKSDLFAMFIERGFAWCKPNGFNSMVTMQSWMFLSSFQSMREKLLEQRTIETMAHLGARAFSEISGEVVQTTAFVLQGQHFFGFKPTFFRLVDGQEADKEAALRSNQCRFDATAQDDFKKIPGSPVAYWVSRALFDVFATLEPLQERAHVRKGLATCDDLRWVRLWHEVDYSLSNTQREPSSEEVGRLGRWFPLLKGGSFRKWYGNTAYLINWENDGRLLKASIVERYGGGSYTKEVRSEDYYFRPCNTWSDITSGSFGARYCPNGFITSTVGGGIYSASDSDEYQFCAMLNSKPTSDWLRIINPTLHANPGDIAQLPLPPHEVLTGVEISRLGRAAVSLTRSDWDAYERSWDFQSFPLLTASADPDSTLESSYTAWVTQNHDTIVEMKRLEEENNRLFIDAYGLQDELTPDVPIEQITLTVNPAYRYGGNLTEVEQWTRFRQDTMEELVSYAIGCMMGRYSLDEPGLIYAHAGNVGFDANRYKTFPADADGIVPITDEFWFEDDAANRVREFLRAVWGADTLDENMAWLAESLGTKANETPDETIRRYLADKFFKDHLQTYKKRPIYWLFSSGKQGAFQALVYLHRYHEGTLARLRAEYVVPLTGKLQARIDMLEKDAAAAPSTATRNKLNKQIEKLRKKHVELLAYDEKLRHYADMRIRLDLDEGVKVNYGKFGDLLAEVKAVTGGAGDE
ncbi:conserved hypothetical protein [Aromatoleum aromaticum EbN1]|uniref:site-specific DNA-methyltransferase (adenine-specific) n=1 Tax=Aromatoleum aromaticum (strain DSM 19018 / LMG 30748 / EbN1) TaxID=76114 RepID=Q5P0S4_AROAE|nr:conserved hypothetical protein [Aromatoleum aromaticum EbN1]